MMSHQLTIKCKGELKVVIPSTSDSMLVFANWKNSSESKDSSTFLVLDDYQNFVITPFKTSFYN